MRRIDVGFACNNACVFCAQGSLRGAPALGAGEANERMVSALAAVVPGEQVAFVGGEPTLFVGLPSWIREATERGAASVLVQTNGRRLAYLAYARELAASSRVLHLDVSLHGSTAAMHDWHTGTAESFAQTARGLRHARAERIPVAITTVVTRSNYRHLAEIVRAAHALGARAVRFASLAPFGRALQARAMLAPAPELVGPYYQRARADAARLGLAVLLGEPAGSESDAFAGLGPVEAPDAPDASDAGPAPRGAPARAVDRVEDGDKP